MRNHRPGWMLDQRINPPSDVDTVSFLHLYRREMNPPSLHDRSWPKVSAYDLTRGGEDCRRRLGSRATTPQGNTLPVPGRRLPAG